MNEAATAAAVKPSRKVREETRGTIALALLSDGFDFDFVAHYTGLSPREVQVLDRRRKKVSRRKGPSILDRRPYAEVVGPMTLMHDPFARVCLHDNVACVGLMLRVILERNNLRVREMAVQKTLPGPRLRGVCLDVFAADDEGRAYNIELQVGGRLEDLIRRSRLYSAYLDMNLLRKGEEYARLAESCVIFILGHDPLGMKRPLYKIDRYFPVDGVYHAFGDGAHIVFVNGANRDETPLGRLLHDLNCPDPDRMHYEELARAVRHYKFTKTGERKMKPSLVEWEEQFKNEGRAEGRAEAWAEAARTFARGMLDKGLPPELVAEVGKMSLAEVRALAKESGR